MKSIWLALVVFAAICLLRMTEAKPDEPGKAPSPTADPMRGKEPGEVRDDNGLKTKLVWCPPGKFKMGSPESDKDAEEWEKPQVDVTLTRGFWLGQTEVTQGQWRSVMQTTPWKEQKNVQDGDDYPATYVSWDDASEFCRKLTAQEQKAARLPPGSVYKLPTHAEWEYGCRAGTSTRYSFGNDAAKLGRFAWFYRNTERVKEPYPHKVRQKTANPWGLHDMHGNVAEWCRDWFDDRRRGGADPAGPATGEGRVASGASWYQGFEECRSALNGAPEPSTRDSRLGIRIALIEDDSR